MEINDRIKKLLNINLVCHLENVLLWWTKVLSKKYPDFQRLADLDEYSFSMYILPDIWSGVLLIPIILINLITIPVLMTSGTDSLITFIGSIH